MVLTCKHNDGDYSIAIVSKPCRWCDRVRITLENCNPNMCVVTHSDLFVKFEIDFVAGHRYVQNLERPGRV